MNNEQYEDIFGYKHKVDKEIARGGQGIVYRTQNSNIAIKLELDSTTMEIVKDVSGNEKYDNIRLLPIPENINLTLPQATLSHVSGYVMTLLDDMNSLEKEFDYSFDKESEYISNWLKELKEENGENIEEFINVIGQYIFSGGRRNRIDAYMKCACILSKLHAQGLVYCDFSSKNAFYSNKSGEGVVWLIDADNLNYQSKTIKEGYYTPGYGAPEVLKGKGCTFYSDSYAFAVSLFWQLTWSHPFIGPLTEEGFDDDFADSSQEKAYSGELPWVCDTEDTSNYLDTKIHQQMVISNKLMNLFQRTFSETGRKKRNTRPSLFEWSYVLAGDLDTSVKCSNCGMDYDGLTNEICPWCDNNNPVIKMTAYVQNKVNERKEIWKYIHENEKKMFIHVPLRLLCGFRNSELESKAFSLRKVHNKIILSDFNERFDFMIENNGNIQVFYGEVEIPGNCLIKCVERKSNKSVWIEVKS